MTSSAVEKKDTKIQKNPSWDTGRNQLTTLSEELPFPLSMVSTEKLARSLEDQVKEKSEGKITHPSQTGELAKQKEKLKVRRKNIDLAYYPLQSDSLSRSYMFTLWIRCYLLPNSDSDQGTRLETLYELYVKTYKDLFKSSFSYREKENNVMYFDAADTPGAPNLLLKEPEFVKQLKIHLKFLGVACDICAINKIKWVTDVKPRMLCAPNEQILTQQGLSPNQADSTPYFFPIDISNCGNNSEPIKNPEGLEQKFRDKEATLLKQVGKPRWHDISWYEPSQLSNATVKNHLLVYWVRENLRDLDFGQLFAVDLLHEFYMQSAKNKGWQVGSIKQSNIFGKCFVDALQTAGIPYALVKYRNVRSIRGFFVIPKDEKEWEEALKISQEKASRKKKTPHKKKKNDPEK